MSAFTINTTCEGNLVAEPVLRQTSDGTNVANFRMAVTTRRPDGNGGFQENTEFINVVAWREMAVNANASLTKGTRVIVSGDMKNRTFEGKDGNDRYVTEIHAASIGVSLRYHVVAGVTKAKDALVAA